MPYAIVCRDRQPGRDAGSPNASNALEQKASRDGNRMSERERPVDRVLAVLGSARRRSRDCGRQAGSFRDNAPALRCTSGVIGRRRLQSREVGRSLPPGTERPRRYVPRFHWELLACGVGGHALFGTDVAEIRTQDDLLVREQSGVRWHRCVRCDSWLPLPPPTSPRERVLPPREALELPLRGKALRDKVVLRIIAVDRALHCVALVALALLLLAFANHVRHLHRLFLRVVADYGGRTHIAKHGLVHDVERLVTLQSGTLRIVALAAALYALLEGLEAVGLWLMKRWAEYLTLVATTLLLPVEVYELTGRVSVFKVLALAVNLAIVVYLLFAKRLFGLRGGAATEQAERQRDSSWEALEATTPREGPPSVRPIDQMAD
jgi:uncharacterized membrane protein (DUF2068 family)